MISTSSAPTLSVLETRYIPSDAPPAGRMVLKLMQRLAVGTLELRLPDGTSMRFGRSSPDDASAPRAVMQLQDWSVCSAVMQSGDIGLAEAYIRGAWTSPDLSALLGLCVRNRKLIEDAVYGNWLGRLYYRLRHLLRHNSKRNSRRNIQAHYDLGNAFYALWLDKSMNYSSAWFDGDHRRSTEAAQAAKVQRALDEVGLPAQAEGWRVLEIGCGWGAVAQAVAQQGAHITGVTLSDEQLLWAQERMRKAGVQARTDLRLQDYRDIQDEPFDALISIEMFEAVGQGYWRSYFDTVRRCLKPGALACIQTITIDDALFERYAESTDFIQQYIFPGGMLPCDREFRRHAAQAGLEVVRAMPFGADYAETLRRWRAQFHAHLEAIAEQGFDTRFQRIWEFYLCYCEAAFDGGNTNVVQYTLRRLDQGPRG